MVPSSPGSSKSLPSGEARISTDLTSATYWAEFFGSTLAAGYDGLTTIFDAWSVRELWLQGELFRAARAIDLDFHVNVNPADHGGKLGFPGKADLICRTEKKRLAMVGELKLYGTSGYYPKNLTGGGPSRST